MKITLWIYIYIYIYIYIINECQNKNFVERTIKEQPPGFNDFCNGIRNHKTKN